MTRATIVVLLFAAVGWASPALGHPLIIEARERLVSADFDGALEVLATAEGESDLTRDDVIELVELRAIINNALGYDDAVTRDLRALASLDPMHRFSPEASPVLVGQFDTMSSEPMELRVDVEQEGESVAIEAVVENDGGGLVRRLVLRGRAVGSGSWQQSEDQRLVIDDASSDSVMWSVEVIGPGEATLLSQARRSDSVPDHNVDGEGSNEREPNDDDVREAGESDDSSTTRRRRRWPIWLSVGVVSAVIIGVVAGVVATNDDPVEYIDVAGPFVGED